MVDHLAWSCSSTASISVKQAFGVDTNDDNGRVLAVVLIVLNVDNSILINLITAILRDDLEWI